MSVIPAIQKVEIGRIMVQGQPGQKVRHPPHLNKKAMHGGSNLLSQQRRRPKVERSQFEVSPRQKFKTLPEK
jgi:hypothetical protein